jgi:hypothetical protein
VSPEERRLGIVLMADVTVGVATAEETRVKTIKVIARVIGDSSQMDEGQRAAVAAAYGKQITGAVLDVLEGRVEDAKEDQLLDSFATGIGPGGIQTDLTPQPKERSDA